MQVSSLCLEDFNQSDECTNGRVTDAWFNITEELVELDLLVTDHKFTTVIYE
jgi:hypothetical protein